MLHEKTAAGRTVAGDLIACTWRRMATARVTRRHPRHRHHTSKDGLHLVWWPYLLPLPQAYEKDEPVGMHRRNQATAKTFFFKPAKKIQILSIIALESIAS